MHLYAANMESRSLLAQALYRILRPLARTAIRHGLTVRDVEQLVRRAFVDSARAEFGIRGRPTNKARVATLTGLSRAEVSRLLAEDGRLPETGQRHLLNRLVTTWVSEADWQAANGTPRRLQLEDGEAGFPALVRAIGSDVPWQTLLRELERLGIAARDHGAAVLLKRAFVPGGDDERDRIPYLGENVAALADTVDYNLVHGGSAPRFERKLVFPGLDAEGLRKLQAHLEREGQAWMERLNHEFTPHSDPDHESGRMTGMGIYFFDTNTPDGGPWS